MIDTYSLLVGVALGAYAVIVLYKTAEAIATWRNRCRDADRRFFVESGAEVNRRLA